LHCTGNYGRHSPSQGTFMCLDSPLKEGAKAKIETFKFQFIELFER